MEVNAQCLALGCQVEVIAVCGSLLVLRAAGRAQRISETALPSVRWPLGIFPNVAPLVLVFSAFLHARRPN